MSTKTIIITGASRGIGKAITDLALQNSDLKVIAITRNARKMEETYKGRTIKPIIIEFDFETDLNSLRNLCNRIKESTWKVDYLINNAADIRVKPFIEFSSTEIEYLFRVNVIAPALLIQALIPLMERGPERAHVVNIGSMGGFQGSAKFPGLSIYASTKAALANLSESLAEELKEKNISVNCLALGAVKTEMLKAAFPNYNGGVPSEVMASFILNFVLSGYKTINGKVLPVSIGTP